MNLREFKEQVEEMWKVMKKPQRDEIISSIIVTLFFLLVFGIIGTIIFFVFCWILGISY